jgi:guanylate cyclase
MSQILSKGEMMQTSWSNSLFERVGSIGGEIADPDLSTQKTVTVAVCLSTLPISVIWAMIALSIGELANAYAIILGGLLILVDLLYLTWRKNYIRFRTTVYVIGLIWILMLHFSIGGFTGSKSLTWALIIPIAALISSRPRESIPWFSAFVVMVVISGLVDPILFPEGIDLVRSMSQFAFSLVTVALIIYLILVYFVRQKNRAYALLAIEQEKSEGLLLNVLPKEIAPILKSGKENIAERHEHTSILFADIVGFTPMSTAMAPEKMVELLNEIFSQFDSLVEKYDLEKVRTIGDNYMVVSGAPRRRKDHAQALAHLALDIRAYISQRRSPGGEVINFRIGMNSGPIIAGVIGKRKFHYDVWGDTVNVASRMETFGVPGKIQLAKDTYDLIKDDFVCESRGDVDIKGKGIMGTWFLKDRRSKSINAQVDNRH